MQLIEKKINKKLDDYNQIGEFMKRVFPKEELMPMWLIVFASKFKKYDFNAYYDQDGTFIGILFTIDSKDTLFVFYLAVNDKIHSKGYGSLLLKQLVDKYQTKYISLFIETLDPNSSNYNQRVKRLTFYKRNGFYESGFSCGMKTAFIDILTTKPDFKLADAKKILSFMPMKIMPTPEWTK